MASSGSRHCTASSRYATTFFEGNADFTDLYFIMADESFEFYGPIKMADNPHWVSVTV